MDIAGLNTRITIQKNQTIVDRYKNHTSVWAEFFSCWATCVTSGRSAEESQEAGYTQEADRLDITVRWCSETGAVNSKEYRILIGSCIYDITGIDEMGFRKNSRKFHTVLTER